MGQSLFALNKHSSVWAKTVTFYFWKGHGFNDFFKPVQIFQWQTSEIASTTLYNWKFPEKVLLWIYGYIKYNWYCFQFHRWNTKYQYGLEIK